MVIQKENLLSPLTVQSDVVKLFIHLLVLQSTLVGNASCGNVLIWPSEGSHWLNVKILIQELLARDHQVSILVSTASIFITPEDISAANFEVYPVPFTKDDFDSLFTDIIRFSLDNKLTTLTIFKFYQELKKQMETANEFHRHMCEGVLANQEFMAKLKKTKYDVLLSDPLTPCGDLIALQLNIPFLYTLRFTAGFSAERNCGKMPAPPSYVPAPLSELSDSLSFGERIKNTLSYQVQDYVYHKIYEQWDSYYSQVLGRPTTMCEIMGKADMWLIRTYWDLDFPRPFLPNFEFVGGLHCQPAKPLPEEMEEFVQSSGEHGIVVFSLGSLVQNVTEEKSKIIASAFSQLPQKVVWRYKGKKPETLGDNTRIYDWIPQNDLLGHPKTKVFITHGGTNGVYEAIYHGVPIVGIPIFGDQPDNILRMKSKGMAVEVNIHTLKTKDLVEAVNTVINNTRFKENAVRISQIHHDQPTKPLDRAVFWIEFVIRHKGAAHLRAAAHHLTWYQYHGLDVIAFLTGCTIILTFIAYRCCSYCSRKCGSILRKTKTE